MAIADFAPFIRKGRFHTQCSGAGLMLAASVRLALPEADVQMVTGKHVPCIGSKIIAIPHAGVDLAYEGRQYRLDSTPTRSSLMDTLYAFGKRLDIRDLRQTASPDAIVVSLTHVQRATKNLVQAQTAIGEYLSSILSLDPSAVHERAVQLHDEDPIRVAASVAAARELPSRQSLQEMAEYVRAVADAEPDVLQKVGMAHYAAHRTSLRSIADRLVTIWP